MIQINRTKDISGFNGTYKSAQFLFAHEVLSELRYTTNLIPFIHSDMETDEHQENYKFYLKAGCFSQVMQIMISKKSGLDILVADILISEWRINHGFTRTC